MSGWEGEGKNECCLHIIQVLFLSLFMFYSIRFSFSKPLSLLLFMKLSIHFFFNFEFIGPCIILIVE